MTPYKEKQNKERITLKKNPDQTFLSSCSQGHDGSEAFIYQHHSGISPRTFRVYLAENM